MAPITSVAAEIWDRESLVNVIVRIVDETGAEGIGETWWGIPDRADPGRAARPMVSVVDDLLGPRLIGREASEIAAIWHDSLDWAYRYGDQGILRMGLSGIDLALWDLASRAEGRTVCDLLGGAEHTALPAYASLPWLRSAAAVLHETRRAIEAGFDAVKLHEVDVEITAHLRRELGDDLTIMVDVNGHFDEADAIEHGRQLADLGVLWFEEPVRPMRDHDAIGRVGRTIGCGLAGGENEYTADDFARLLTSAPVRYVQPELTKVGGLTAAPTIGRVVAEHERELCPHAFRVGPALVASIHWAFSSSVGSWIEVPWFQDGVSCSFGTPLPSVENGRILAPSEPGLRAYG